MREVVELAHDVTAKPIQWKSLLALIAAFAVIIGITFFYSKDKRNVATAPAAAHTTITPALHKPA